MGYPLRQATAAQVRAIGPFLDDTDFKTAETGLTIANTDIKLVVNGGASANKNSGGGTHRINGVYGLTFDATDTAAVGEIFVSVVVAGALPVFDKYNVVEEAVYDSLYAASAPGYVPAALAIVDEGTAQSATTTTLVLRSATTFANDELNGAIAYIASGTGAGQSRVITDYVGSTDTATVDAWTTTPSGTILYKVFAMPPGSSTVPIDVNVTQIAGQTANAAAAVTFPATVASTTNITAGTVTTATNVTTVNGLAANVLTAAATAADFTTEIQTGLATAAALTIVDDFLDSEVAAIKAKTDQLIFTKALELDVNIQSVNGVTVTGTGEPGNTWGP